MGFNEYSTANAVIQAKAITPADVQSTTTPSMSATATDEVREQLDALKGYKGHDTEALRGRIEEYYTRGINLLKPEIVSTTEFVPIRKDFNDSPGLQVKVGSRKISVNQVFKLIELHHSVQKSVNIASLEFVEQNIGFDIKVFYDEVKKRYTSDILKSNLEESISAFMATLDSEHMPFHAPAQVIGSAGTIVGNDTTPTGLGFIFHDFEDTVASESGSVVGTDGLIKMVVPNFPFRLIIEQGSQLQRATIKRIIEIVILEKITKSLFVFFKRIVILKEIEIPKFLDITKLSTSSGLSQHADMTNESRNNCTSLKRYYVNLEEPITEEASELTIIQTSTGENIETSSLEGAFKFIMGDNLAQHGLCVNSLVSGTDNYAVIFSIFNAILKNLTCNTPGNISLDMLASSNSGLPSDFIINDSNGINEEFYERITMFFNSAGLSSFLAGNSVKLDSNIDTNDEGGIDTYTKYYTTKLLNDTTLDTGGKWPISDSMIKSFIGEGSDESIERHHSKHRFFDSDEFKNNLDYASELLGAAIFDTVYTLNNRKYNTDSFQGSLSILGPGTERSIDRYIKRVLGQNGTDYIHATAGRHNFFRISDAVSYSDSDVKSGDIQQNLGHLGNVLFANKTILNDTLNCLPGSNRDFKPLNYTMNGATSIPLQAFSERSFDALESYTKDLEQFANKTYKDMASLFGVFENQGGKVSKGVTPNQLMDEILLKLVDRLDLVIDSISDYTSENQTFNTPRTAISLATAIAAGQDKKLLSMFFAAHYMRTDGYFDNNVWFKAMRADQTSGVVTRLFKSILGKSLQKITHYSMTTQDANTYHEGVYSNLFLQVKGSVDIDSTFINQSKFNGSRHFVGRALDEDDFETWEKMSFQMKNTADRLSTYVVESIRDTDGHIMTHPVETLKEFIKRSDPDYASVLSNQTNNPAITDVFEREGSPGQGGASESNRNYNYYKIDSKAEKPGRFSAGSLFNSTDLQREFAIFAYICKLLNECLTVRFEFQTTNHLKITFSKKQLIGLRDAIKNTSVLIDDAATSIMWGKPSEAEDEINHQKSIITETKKPVYQRSSRAKVCYSAIYSHINNLINMKAEIRRSVSDAALSDAAKLAIKYYGITENADQTPGSLMASTAENDITSFNARKSLLEFLSSKSLPVFYKNYNDYIRSSRDNILFSSWENITDRQIYQMQLAFSSENFGKATSEKLGKKTILNVGIPPGQLFQLGLTANKNHGDINYYNSPYLCIHIFKKDAIGGDIKYYPKPFLFNSSLVSFENFSPKANPSDMQTLVPYHELEHMSINSYEALLNVFSLYKYDMTAHSARIRATSGYEDLLNRPSDLEYIDQTSAGNRSIALKELKINHMNDYYLKMYMKLTTGLDVTELAFPLNSYNKLTGQVDSNVVNLYEKYRNDLFLKYPSINVDPVLAREFIRLEKNIASSRLFSLNEKVKNVFSAKCFDRIFSVFINEADFVVYPYPDIIEDATQSIGQGKGSVYNSLINSQAFVDSLDSLYDPCPYFNLNSARQIYGVNNITKAKLAQDAVQAAALGLTNLATQNQGTTQDKFLSGKYRQFFKHMNEIESENVADIYEFFAVVSVIRSK